MKMALKRKNGEFLVMPRKHVLSVMGPENPLEPKQCAVAHNNGHKRKNDEFLVMHIKQVPSVMGLKITLKTQNCGLLLTKMARKCKKRQVFGHASQTCT
jgi:hypothetical protein